MPPKRNRRKKIQVKSQKVNSRIIKRLMEISIKVDKYIYKSRPISVEQARLYMREVSLYRDQSRNDERSIQVIEKLTRNMQAIIEEQTTDITHDCVKHSFDSSVGLSPVYSLPDEDRALLTQFITDDSINAVNESKSNDSINQNPTDCIRDNRHEINGTVSYDISHNETQFIQTVADVHHNSEITDINVVNLCSDDGVSEYNVQNNKADVEITEVINDLTLNDTEPCSQSILRNLSIPDTVTMSAPFNNKYFEVHTHNLAPNLIQQHEIPKETKDNKTIDSKPLKSCLKTPKGSETSNKNDIVGNSTENKTNINKKTKIMSTQPNKRRKKPCKDILTSEYKIVAVETSKKLKTTKKIAKSYQNTNDGNKLQISHPRSNDSSLGHSKNRSSKNYFESLSISNIQNEYVNEENFWIENLKYVREISVEEYDPKLNDITDSFWVNCHLPDGWDDNDFDLFL